VASKGECGEPNQMTLKVGRGPARCWDEKLEGFGDDDFGGVAGERLEFSAAAEERIAVEEIRDGEPLVETEGAGAVVVGAEDGRAGAAEAVEVPFAEVAGGVAGVAEGARERFLLEAEGEAVVLDAGAVVGAAGHDGGAGGRAIGRAGVETIEAQAGGGHGVEVRGFEERVAVVAGFAPAHVVGHDEDDVGAGGGGGVRRRLGRRV
jgi:hypothetical protein